MKKRLSLSLVTVFITLASCMTPGPGGHTGRIALDAACVPASLRDLVPLAAEWGCADPEERDAMEREMTPAQAVTVRDALHARAPEIRAWLGTVPRSGRCAAEASAFGGLLSLYDDIRDIQLMRGLR